MKRKLLYFLLACGCCLLLTACQQALTNKNSHNAITSKTTRHHQVDLVAKKIKQMTLSEKIGQLYFIHSNGDFKQNKALIRNDHLGGIALFAPDLQNRSRQTLRRQLKQYQSASNLGLFIATDQEGGTVSRLSSNPALANRKFPSPQEVYRKSGLVGIKQENQTVAKILRANGINQDFAPVADVAQDKNSFIYPRTLGENYQTTARYITTAVKALQSQKVAATLKHFPGYGDAKDTHTGFAQINKPLFAYQNEDLIPFQVGIKAGVDQIMVSHIFINNLDRNYPASLSKKVHHYLRTQMNYQGLIISDDLQMGAITQFCQKKRLNADLLALKAGNDLLLGGNPQTGIPIIKKAVEKHEISEHQIDQSLHRILKLKQKLGILK